MATAFERLQNVIYRTKNAMMSGTLTDSQTDSLKGALATFVNAQKSEDDLIRAAETVLDAIREGKQDESSDIGIEMNALGCMCLSPDAARYSFDILSRSSFFTPQMQDFYTGLCEAAAANVPMEEIKAIIYYLRTHGWLEKLGGMATVHEAIEGAGSASSIEWYAKKLREMEIRRGTRKISECLLDKSRFGTVKEYVEAMKSGMAWIRESVECYKRHRRIPANPVPVTEDEKRC